MTDLTRPTLPDVSCEDVRDLAASFVLGALDEAEADAVRAHLASCADPHAEVAELGSVIAAFAETVPVVEPPPALKGRIMAAVAADLEARGGARGVAAPVAVAPPPVAAAVEAPTSVARPAPVAVLAPPAPAPAAPAAETPTPFPGEAERQQRAVNRAGAGSWVLRIAAVLAIALLGGWNLLLQAQLNESVTYEQNVAAVLDVAGQPGALTAVLTPEGGEGPAGLAAVASDGSVRIAMRDLPATSGNQVYEAWVIGSDGNPVAIGGFKVGQTGVGYFETDGIPAEDGIVLALTLEPEPGATAPSGPPVSAGTATAAG